MRNRRTIVSQSFVIAFWLAFVGANPPQLMAAKDDSVIESLKVAENGNLLLVPVNIKGRRYEFILDTGSSQNVFDPSLKHTLQETNEIGVIGDTDYQLYRSPSASVGKSAIPIEGDTICRDLSQIRKYSGRDIRGILGTPFLRKQIVQIDFDHGQLSFLRTAKTVSGLQVPIMPDQDDRPFVKVAVPDVGEIPFLIDTGFCAYANGALASSLIDRLGKARTFSIDKQSSLGVGLNGNGPSRQGTIRSLSLGPFRHNDQSFIERDKNILGLGYLSRFFVTFDFEGRKMYLEKGKGFDKSFPIDTCGMRYVMREDVLEVIDVATDGPGYRSGIRRGDQILTIDDSSPANMSAYDRSTKLNASPGGVVLRTLRASDHLVREVHIRR
jgi:hypothetical protein